MLHQSRGVEPICCEISRDIEELSRGQKVTRSVDLAIERCQDCDKNQLKSSINNLVVERCRATMKLYKINTSSLVSWIDLHGFNTRLELLKY